MHQHEFNRLYRAEFGAPENWSETIRNVADVRLRLAVIGARYWPDMQQYALPPFLRPRIFNYALLRSWQGQGSHLTHFGQNVRLLEVGLGELRSPPSSKFFLLAHIAAGGTFDPASHSHSIGQPPEHSHTPPFADHPPPVTELRPLGWWNPGACVNDGHLFLALPTFFVNDMLRLYEIDDIKIIARF